MAFIDFLQSLVSDYTLRTITLGTAVMGIICGALGSFAVLRQQSLLGDAISHSALPGIAIAFLLTGSKEPEVIFTGAAVSGLLATVWFSGIITRTRLKSDTGLGIVLSVFFGFGMLLLTFIQKIPDANQAGLDKFLFGQAATLMVKDVIFMAIAGGISLIIVLLFWKEFKLMAFDPQYAKTLGFNIRMLDKLLIVLIVIAIILGLQTVGVVLMSAMLLAPAAAARQWTNKLSVMVLLSSVFGALSGIVGTAISSTGERLSTGPVIVLVSVAVVAVSFVFAPGRGLLAKQIRYWKNRNNILLNKTLSLMYEVAHQHEDYRRPHSLNILNNFHGYRKRYVYELQQKGLILLDKNNQWTLTEYGYKTAENLYNEQLWEAPS